MVNFTNNFHSTFIHKYKEQFSGSVTAACKGIRIENKHFGFSLWPVTQGGFCFGGVVGPNNNRPKGGIHLI